MGVSSIALIFAWLGMQVSNRGKQSIITTTTVVAPTVRELGFVRSAAYRSLESYFSVVALEYMEIPGAADVLDAERRELIETQKDLKVALANYLSLTTGNSDRYPFVEEIARQVEILTRLTDPGSPVRPKSPNAIHLGGLGG